MPLHVDLYLKRACHFTFMPSLECASSRRCRQERHPTPPSFPIPIPRAMQTKRWGLVARSGETGGCLSNITGVARLPPPAANKTSCFPVGTLMQISDVPQWNQSPGLKTCLLIPPPNTESALDGEAQAWNGIEMSLPSPFISLSNHRHPRVLTAAGTAAPLSRF